MRDGCCQMVARSRSPVVSRKRPGAAVVAGVLGIVFGAQVVLGSFTQFSNAAESGMTWLLAVMALIGVLWLVGGVQIFGARRQVLLIGSVAWLALLLGFLVWGSINTLVNPDSSIPLVWVAVIAVFFAAVPGAILAFAYRPTVTNWIIEGSR